MNTMVNVLIHTGALAAFGFVARFLMTNWYKTVAGRLTMCFVSAASAILILAVLTTDLGREFPGRETLRLITYFLINVTLWWSLAVLWLDQKRSRRERTSRDRPQ